MWTALDGTVEEASLRSKLCICDPNEKEARVWVKSTADLRVVEAVILQA